MFNYCAQICIMFIRRVLITHNYSVRIAVLYHHVNIIIMLESHRSPIGPKSYQLLDFTKPKA